MKDEIRPIDKYENIVGYGIGQYYEKIKSMLSNDLRLTALCDKRFEEKKIREYDGLPVLSFEEASLLRGTLFVIMAQHYQNRKEIEAMLTASALPFIHVDQWLKNKVLVSGRDLRKHFPAGKYEDENGNSIVFHISIPPEIHISFEGKDNSVIIEENVMSDGARIFLGNHGSCRIGRNTEIADAQFFISESKVNIGENCLFSTQIHIRTHDGHHIFDKASGQRINYPKDIIIGNQVWIGQRSLLLGGAYLGHGSVMGAGSVTSSRFDNHVIIAGSPAKVVRKNICWSKDNTRYFNRDYFGECLCQEAKMFF